MNIPKISQNINNNYSMNQSQNPNFGSISATIKNSKFFSPVKKVAEPAVKVYHGSVNWLADAFGRLFQTDAAKWVVDKSKNNKNLFNHLMTTASVVLSGFYILRTLANKDLDDKKKKTLAINQTLVFGVATLACYTIEEWIKSKVNTFANHFEAVNHNFIKDEAKLRKYRKGIDPASKMMVYDMIFRFIAPVFITPLANYIGNKLNEKQIDKKQSLNKNV